MKYRCIVADKYFTEGRIYEVVDDEFDAVRDDSGDHHEIVLGNYDQWWAAGDDSCFEIVQELPPLPEVSEYEDEAFEDLEKKLEQQKKLSGILAKDHVHIGWTQEETGAPEESVDCPVAIAYHIHELQKWLKHIGCDEELELKIATEYVWVSPFPEVVYEAKEGGVGTLIEYMRHVGGANKCVEKMGDVG